MSFLGFSSCLHLHLSRTTHLWKSKRKGPICTMCTQIQFQLFLQIAYILGILPVVLLIILTIRSMSLPGANIGLRYFLTTPNFAKLSSGTVSCSCGTDRGNSSSQLQTWATAAMDILYTFGFGTGCMTTLTSYNTVNTNQFRNVIVVAIL